VSVLCAGVSTAAACASAKLAMMLFEINFQTARDLHEINEKLARLESVQQTILRAAAAARQRSQPPPTTEDESATSPLSSLDSGLGDDWWCLFAQSDTAHSKQH
jgi:hypothetical protein